jgi:hypothetical protein
MALAPRRAKKPARWGHSAGQSVNAIDHPKSRTIGALECVRRLVVSNNHAAP